MPKDAMGLAAPDDAGNDEAVTIPSAIAHQGRILDGRYRLVRHLADGAMGSVWEAEHLALETIVAVKLIREPRPDWVRRFRRESKVVAKLTSPYVVRVFDYGVDDTTPYFVMERLYGRTMADHLATVGGPLTPAVTARLIRQIANGLAEAHRQGVIHRDLKPQNIWLLDGAGGFVAKILDFGLATGGIHDQNDGGNVLSGTPRYMSPEQYDASAAIDHRSDLWALAAITYECLTGAPAYPQGSITALMVAITAGTVPAPSAATTVPDGVDAWCARALHRDPAERFQSATEAAEALSALCVPQQMTPSAPIAQGPGEAKGPTLPLTGTTLPDFEKLRTNLVSAGSRFIGRQAELARLDELVAARARMITLLGPAGAGKTRLAREFGLSQGVLFAGGVWFVDLAEATGVEGMCTAVAQALQVPVGGSDPVTRLGYAIAGRGPTLVLIDNFEHIVDAASPIIAQWSTMAPDATFLITSRERLRLDGETVVDVDLQPRTDAIRLFESRAQDVSPQFTVNAENEGAVGQIVDRLDRLPLAIELAAARMRMLTLSQLDARLAERFRLLRGRRRDQGARQATMRGAIDWSWALLTPEERLLFAQLSVFHGGFDMEAVDAVVDLATLDASAWPDEIMESLVEKSLVRCMEVNDNERRFLLLESMRAYAAEKLAAPPGEFDAVDSTDWARAARQRHRDHYGELGAANIISSLDIAGGHLRRAALNREQYNLEAAITTGLEDDDACGAARAWLARFWGVIETRGPYRPAAEKAVELLKTEAIQGLLRARLARGAATAFRLCGQQKLGIEYCDEALLLAQASNAPGLCVNILRERGTCLLALGDLDTARMAFDESIQLAQTHQLRRLRGVSLGARAEVYFWSGGLADARKAYDESVTLLHAVGERRFFASAVGNRALVEYELGDLESARAGFKAALTFLRRLGDRRGESNILANIALVDQAEGRFEQAIRGQRAAIRIDRESGNRPGESIRLANLGLIFTQMGRDPEAEISLDAALTLADDARSPVVGMVQVYQALLAARRGDFETADAKLAAGESILAATSHTEWAKAACVRGEIALLRGDRTAAEAAHAAAKKVADAIHASPRSELGRALITLHDAINATGEGVEETSK